MLTKLNLKPGINREITPYAHDSGWYSCDKIRFRQGFPEKIGGWQAVSQEVFLGVARSIWAWPLLNNIKVAGIGTHLKFYLERGGAYYDITPIRDTTTLTNPFQTTEGSAVVVVTEPSPGFINGDFVTFSDATEVGGLILNGEYQITSISGTSYSIESASPATSSATGGGTVSAEYQINTGYEFSKPLVGWGAGTWSSGPWGIGEPSAIFNATIRVWNQRNFGEDLIFGPTKGALYYWDATEGLNSRGVLLSELPDASQVPILHRFLFVSDVSRFVFVFGTNEVFSTDYDPMLIRWSDQENVTEWMPTALNQAGSIRLSRGSEIKSVLQSRQEILVWTDSSLYSLQFAGAPVVWGTQLLGDNISIVSSQAAAFVNGTAFWMGRGGFYIYDGRVQVLPCTLQKYVFENINPSQEDQIFAGINEQYREVWWFYCSSDSIVVDSYIVYNYLENLWYYGSLERSAWLDSSIIGNPVAATYNGKLVLHEAGSDDSESNLPQPIEAHIESSYFAIQDGERFAFVWRMLPDVSFLGSDSHNPSLTISLTPLASSGAGYTNPASVGGQNTFAVPRTREHPVEEYTKQINTRVRGRQMSVRISSDGPGIKWQLGSLRFDIKPDGRRGG